MKKLVAIGIAAFLLFALSATVSWLARSRPSTQLKTAGESEGGWTLPANLLDRKAKVPASGDTEPSAPPQPAARPPFVDGAEEAAQLAARLRDRLAKVQEKETQLTTRQKQFELVYEDILGARAALDEMRSQVGLEMKAVEEKMALLERNQVDAEQKRQGDVTKEAELKKSLVELEKVEQANIKKMAEMYNTMEADSAARILEQLGNSGKLDTAVKLLGQMKERQAAKVLAALPPDSGLAAQLLEKLKGYKPLPVEPKKSGGP